VATDVCFRPEPRFDARAGDDPAATTLIENGEHRAMKARIVPVRQLTAEDEEAWRVLAERAIEPNPLFEPDCIIPAARHQEFGDEIDVVFAEEDGRIFGCLPVREVNRWRQFPYPFVTNTVRRMMYCGTPLVDRERGEDALAAIFETLRERRGLTSGRVLVVQEIAEGGPVDQILSDGARQARLPFYRYESWERPVVRRRSQADYRSIHGGKFLRNLGRLRRNLGTSLGAEVLHIDRSDDPAAVQELIRLEGAGYKARTGVAMTTVPGEPEYFTEMADRFRAAGRLHLHSLEVNGRVCAMQLNVRAGDGLFLLKLVYDEGLAKFRPGLQLHLDVIDDFHDETDADWLDTCTYEGNETLLRMYPDRKRFCSYFVPLGRNPVDRAAARTFMAVRPLHKRLYETIDARRSGATAVAVAPSADDQTTQPAAPGGEPVPAAVEPEQEPASIPT
jgi:CelD/BcsL family acetyltransferase involved in cellulose biosynthesis